jgi:hypothetical protein
MKRIVSRLLSGLTLFGLVWPALAGATDGGENPYIIVTNRNAFDLKPIPPPADPNIPPPAPPTKITLQGITVLFGKKQVLLKIPAPPEAGKPPKELPLIMEEGDRQGTIEVLRIDPETRDVEFKDSGNLVKLNLKDFVTKTPGAPVGAVPPPGPLVPGVPRPVVPGVPMPMPIATPTAAPSIPLPSNIPPRPLRTGAMTPSATPLAAGLPTITTATPQPQQVQLTPEEQIVVMEVVREQTKDAVARGDLPPLPPTPLTPASSMPPRVPPTPGGK